MRRRVLTITISVLLALVALAAGTCLALLGGESIHPGVRISGIDVGGLTKDEAAKRLPALTRDAESTKVVLTYEGRSIEAAIAELGGSLDVRSCVESAYREGREGNVFQRVSAVISARRNGADVPPVFAFDEDRVTARLRSIAQQINRPAANARLEVAADGGMRAVPEKPGLKLDVEKSVARVVQAVNSGEMEAALVVEILQPEVTARDFAGIDGVLSSFSTPYKAYQRDRTHNLQLACKAINGTLLKSGETFSYNETVGPRTKEKGYRNAPIFVLGEVEPGMGGGVCQVSTTLYNAALLADMKIVKRSPHSQPVTYVSVGRDATVVYPSRDLKFQNTSEYPIYIAASAQDGRVRISVFGATQAGQEVEVVTAGHQVISAPVVKTREDGIEPGKTIVRKSGRAGHRISVYRVVKSGGKVVRRELVSNDYYSPQSRVVAVGKPAPAPEVEAEPGA